MRPLRYNVTVDGCCDYRVMGADEDLNRHAVQDLRPGVALIFGPVSYELTAAAWRLPVPAGVRPQWMAPFARTIGAAKKYVVPVAALIVAQGDREPSAAMAWLRAPAPQ